MNIGPISSIPWSSVSEKEQRIFNMIYNDADRSDNSLHRMGACICFQGEGLLGLQPE
jgi:hypothetical protein